MMRNNRFKFKTLGKPLIVLEKPIKYTLNFNEENMIEINMEPVELGNTRIYYTSYDQMPSFIDGSS